VHNTCVDPVKHLLIAFLRAVSLSVPTVNFDISVSVNSSATSCKKELYAFVVEFVCMNVGPKQMGDSPVDLFATEISLYTVGVTWNSPRLKVLSMSSTWPLFTQQNRFMSRICCELKSAITWWLNPFKCLTVWTNDDVFVSSSKVIIWSAALEGQWVSVLFNLYFIFRIRWFANYFFSLSTSLTERCFTLRSKCLATRGFVLIYFTFVSMSFTKT